jgi:CheY-like chemotaxis protein/PAS domain-containing protein
MAKSPADRDGAWLDSLPTPLAMFDAGGHLVFANAAWALVTGTAAALGLGKPIAAALAALGPISDGQKLAQQLARVCEGKAKTSRVEVTCVDLTIDTVQRMLEFTIQKTAEGAPFGAAAAVSMVDVTDARHAEARISRAEARLMSLAEQSQGGLVLVTEIGEIMLATAAACALLGVKEAASSLPGLTVSELAERAALLTPADRRKLATLAAGQGLHTATLAVKRVAVASDDGDAGSIITVEALQAVPAEAPAPVEREQQLVRTQLIETIGHELAVVLEGATAASIRAEQMELDPSVVSYLERIRGAAEASLTGIGSLVAVTGKSGRQAAVKVVPLALRAFLADLIKQVVLTAEAHGVALRVKVEQDVADALEADAERLRLALKTLLECALTAPRTAEVLLHVAPEFFSENAMTARFSVTSRAEGDGELPQQNSTRIAIAQFALHALESELKADSSARQASHYFLLAMPVRHEMPSRARKTYVSLHGMPVLIVSSNPKQRLQLAGWLKTARMLPLEADNAAMALALLNRLAEEGNPVPLVILENQLPIQDGFLLAFRIRNDEHLAQTLVVMLANQGRPGDALACRENGIAAYLPQPVPKARLLEAIGAVTGAGEEARDIGINTEVLVTRHTLREERNGPTVLLIEDDAEECQRIEDAFRRVDGTVAITQTWADGLAQASADVFDMVIARHDLVAGDAGEAIAALRQRLIRNGENTPVFALSRSYSLTLDQECRAQGFTAVMLKPAERDELITLALKIARQGVRKRAQSA